MQTYKDAAAGEFNRNVETTITRFKEEAAAAGLTGPALARYRAEHQAMNRVLQEGRPITDSVVSGIRAIGDAAEASAKKIEDVQKQIKAMDEMRSDVRGFLGDIVSGFQAGESAAKVFQNALLNLLNKIMNSALDSIVSGLFGQQGTTQGGLLGNLFGGTFNIRPRFAARKCQFQSLGRRVGKRQSGFANPPHNPVANIRVWTVCTEIRGDIRHWRALRSIPVAFVGLDAMGSHLSRVLKAVV